MTDPIDVYPWISYLTAFFSSSDAKDSWLTLSGYSEDDFDSNNNKADIGDIGNTGLKDRARLFALSKEVELFSKIHITPHTTPRLLLPNVNLGYIFHLNTPEFALMTTSATEKYKFKITKCSLMLKRIDVSPAIRTAHAQLLSSHNAIYPCDRIAARCFDVPASAYSFNIPDLFSNLLLPTSITMVMVKSAARQGSYSENPFSFTHANLKSVTCYVGSRRVPSASYNIDMKDGRAMRLLWETLIGTGVGFKAEKGIGGLDRSAFLNGATILNFDLSRDAAPLAPYHNHPIDARNIRLEASFSEPLADSISVICLARYLTAFELDKAGNVLTLW